MTGIWNFGFGTEQGTRAYEVMDPTFDEEARDAELLEVVAGAPPCFGAVPMWIVVGGERAHEEDAVRPTAPSELGLTMLAGLYFAGGPRAKAAPT